MCELGLNYSRGESFLGRKDSWVLKDQGEANKAKMKQLKQENYFAAKKPKFCVDKTDDKNVVHTLHLLIEKPCNLANRVQN